MTVPNPMSHHGCFAGDFAATDAATMAGVSAMRQSPMAIAKTRAPRVCRTRGALLIRRRFLFDPEVSGGCDRDSMSRSASDLDLRKLDREDAVDQLGSELVGQDIAAQREDPFDVLDRGLLLEE